jgi:hypothetical protein
MASVHEHLDRVLEQGLGHGRTVGGHRLQPARHRELPQVLDGERRRGGDPRVGPGRLSPCGEPARWARLVEAEAGLGDLLLDREEPAVALPQVVVDEVEAEEADVRVEDAGEDARFTTVSSVLGVPGPLAGMASTTVFG